MLSHKTYTVEEALTKMQKYCAYQERCHQEVYRKLVEMRMIPEVIDHIIVSLIQENFLNEERFAHAFTRGKFRMKKWGKQRIALELKRRNISKTLINSALKTIEDQEYIEVFNELAQKRFNVITEKNNFKKKKKLIDYLLYRGWETYLVYDKVNELCK